MVVTSQGPLVDEGAKDTGPLDIKDRRSWSRWQVLAFLGVFGLVGILLGHCGARSHANAERKALYTAPASGSSPATTTAQPSAGDQVTTTTIAVTSATTAAPGAAGPGVVLIPNTQGSGPKALPPFAAGGPWTIGWAFRCVLAPGGAGPFQVFAVPEGDPPSPPQAVDQNGRQNQGTTTQPTTGRQHLEIRTDPACAWAIKVTGPAG